VYTIWTQIPVFYDCTDWCSYVVQHRHLPPDHEGDPTAFHYERQIPKESQDDETCPDNLLVQFDTGADLVLWFSHGDQRGSVNL